MYYAMKVHVFLKSMTLLNFLSEKSSFESKVTEFKYFNRRDIDDLKSWQQNGICKIKCWRFTNRIRWINKSYSFIKFGSNLRWNPLFLKSEILKRIENENNIINYKNLNIINPSIIKNIYWDNYIEIRTRQEYGKHFYGSTKVKDSEDELFSYIKLDFDLMKWKRLKYDIFMVFN